jgi:hypothetical protein
VHVLAASGHWPFVDAAPTVDRLLTQFLVASAGRTHPTQSEDPQSGAVQAR